MKTLLLICAILQLSVVAIFGQSLNVPDLISPVNESDYLIPFDIKFKWSPLIDADSYNIQIALDYEFENLISESDNYTGTDYIVHNFSPLTTYYWRVQAVSGNTLSRWSDIWYFGTSDYITIGNGLNFNSNTSFPAPFGQSHNGAIHQILIKAEELIEVGKVKGWINSLGFNVENLNSIGSLDNFLIKIKHSTASSLDSFNSDYFTVVYGPYDVELHEGWNNFLLDMPFYWNGTANIIIDVCFNNFSLENTSNASTYFSTTTFNSCVYYYSDNEADICINPDSVFTTNNRPNIIFDNLPLLCCDVNLINPDNHSINISLYPTFEWSILDNMQSYRLQICNDYTFNSLIYDISGILPNELLFVSYTLNAALTQSFTYYWRIGCYDEWNFEYWSSIYSFTTNSNYCTLYIPSGWSSISSYINPEYTSIESLLSPISDNLVVMKNGNGELYIPEYGIDLLHNWDINDGYQVYMTNPDTLTITGNIIAPENTPLNLNAGWNLISYLRGSPLAIEQALSGILNQIIVVKDNYGGLYIPSMGINLIGNMLPGQGYHVYLSEGAVLTYPGN